MVKVLLRLVQEIAPDQWMQLEEVNKKFDEMETKFGYPPKTRYRGLLGPDSNVLVIERIWESMAKMEEIMEKASNNSEYLGLSVKLLPIIKSTRMELYMVL